MRNKISVRSDSRLKWHAKRKTACSNAVAFSQAALHPIFFIPEKNPGLHFLILILLLILILSPSLSHFHSLSKRKTTRSNVCTYSRAALHPIFFILEPMPKSSFSFSFSYSFSFSFYLALSHFTLSKKKNRPLQCLHIFPGGPPPYLIQ
jgi:hypothetical protein